MSAIDERTSVESLLDRIRTRQAKVGIVGLGYVGLPLAFTFLDAGFEVLGFDVDPEKPRMLHAGQSYIRHIGLDRVAAAFAGGRISATTDFSRLGECDAIAVCVPTPLGEHREPDLSHVEKTMERIAKQLRPGQLVVLESTSYPGTTREVVLPRLEASGLVGGRDFFLAYSPERQDPGNKSFDTKNIPKIVGALDADSRRMASELYGSAVDQVVAVSSPEVAESAKLLENIFRSVNIALVNEMKMVLERMGIDIWEVIDAAKTKPFGFMPFYPGPGLGGHCIPLDPFYLTWKAAQHGIWARFIELAGEVNTSMPRVVVEKTLKALNTQRKSLNGSKVLVLGLSYKSDIDDDRESPSFAIMALLRELGAEVSYCDPHISISHPGRKQGARMASVPCTAEELARYDAIVLATAHREFRDPELYRSAKIVVDTRNAIPPESVGGLYVRA
jgi:UDP-N-acetyl-D-glucosamine dehydrogenase